jgi:subtilisin family serine protease
MLKRLAFTLSVAAVLAASGIRATGQAPQASTRDVIVVFYDDERDVDGLAAQHGRAYGAEISARYHSALKGYAAKIPQTRIDDVRRDPRVAFVSDDRDVEALAQTVPTGVHRIDAESSSHYASNDWSTPSTPVATAVAVIDTGSGPHADLNIAGGVNCQTGKGYSDGNGHGTHVAGTIGAINNGSGVAGVAPGIPIYSVRVLDNRGSGRFSNIICGIDWVTANASRLNIKVANMSLGGAGTDDGNCGNTNGDALHKAICSSVAAGVTYVVAAGNDGANMAGSVPASYNEVLSVTAVADFNGDAGGGAAATCRADVDDTAADFSNFATPGSPDEGHTDRRARRVHLFDVERWRLQHDFRYEHGFAPRRRRGRAVHRVRSVHGDAGRRHVQARSDAAAQDPSYGFVGDPNHVIGGRAYGYLLRAGAY